MIAVVTRAGIDRAFDLFEFFKELRAEVQLDIYDVRWLDLISGAGKVSGLSDLAPLPEEVGRFLVELFDLLRFWDQERQVDFKELRQEVKMVMQPEIDLGDPFPQETVRFPALYFDPDGRVFSCDPWVNVVKTALGDISPGFPGDHFGEQGRLVGKDQGADPAVRETNGLWRL